MRYLDMAPSRAKPHRVIVSITTIYDAGRNRKFPREQIGDDGFQIGPLFED
jgi:hypothetical protein